MSDTSEEHSWSFTTGKGLHNNAFSVVSVTPLNGANGVAVYVKPSVTLSLEMTSALTQLVSVSLWQGTTLVKGTVSSSGKTVTFIPTTNLTANAEYIGNVVFGTKGSNDEKEGDDDNKYAEIFTWNITTVGGAADDTAPTVLSVTPTNNATGVASSIHPSCGNFQ